MSLVGPRRTSAVVRTSARARIGLGLRLPGQGPGGRSLAAPAPAGEPRPVRVPPATVDDVDDEVTDLLRRADAADR